MKILMRVCMLVLLAKCVPVASNYTSKSYGEITEFNKTDGSIVLFNNENLETTHLKEYAEFRRSQTGYDRDDKNISVFVPREYRYILDTLVIRWHLWDSVTQYSLNVRDIYDQHYASIKLETNALMIHPSFRALNADRDVSMLLLFFQRVDNPYDYSRTVTLKPEDHVLRKQLVKQITLFSKTEDKVDYLVEQGYGLDALSLIELELINKYNTSLAKRYWDIANEILINIPPNLNR
ncbi:MAG: hypothetical protein AAFY41_09145 [Bacteroidota bacterium]